MITNKQLNRLRIERERIGWSRQRLINELTKLIDNGRYPISMDQVGRWERGQSTPSSFWREKLCEVYSKTAEELGMFVQITAQQEVIKPEGIEHPQKSYHAPQEEDGQTKKRRIKDRYTIQVNLTQEEAELLDHFQQRLQERYGSEVRVTQRTVVIVALKNLAKHLESSDEAENEKR
jgi:transcriptional regulator with XRE-family HTH domain